MLRRRPSEADQEPLPRLQGRLDVQGLRAVAVTVVILGHGQVPGFRGGFVGVDVFFVVSGFVISTLLLHEATSTGRVRIGAFYARRARRILPAATLVLMATAVAGAVLLPVSRIPALVEDIRWAAAFLANVHFSQLGTDYFQQDRATSPVQHTWSLAVEEQFYLVWPVVLLALFVLLARRRVLVTRLVVLAAWAASFAWSVLLTTRSPVPAYFSSATRAWELATGALIALSGHQLNRLTPAVRHLLVVVGLLGIAASVGWYDEGTAFPGWRAAVPVAGTAALLVAGAGGAVGAARLLTLRPCRYVGDISYSLYLWHWPVLVLGAYVLGHQPGLREDGALFGIILVASVLSYHLVENPLRRGRGPALGGLRALALWPAMLVLVLGTSTWAATSATHRFEARVSGGSTPRPADPALAVHEASGSRGRQQVKLPDPDLDALIDASLRAADRRAPIPFPLVNLRHLGSDLWQHKFDCYALWEESRVRMCPRGDTHSRRTVVLYGDSHAGMWLPPLDLLGRRDGFRLVPLIKLGCAPFDVEQLHQGAPLPACPPFRTWALKQIAKLHPDVVLLAFRSLLEVVPDGGQTPEQAWRSGARSSLHALTRISPRVEVISDVTYFDYSPGDCLTAPGSTMASCTARVQPTTNTGNALSEQAARESGSRYVDVTGLVCRHGRCPLVVDGVVTYRDAWHLSRTWSRIVATELGRRLRLP